VAPGLQQAEAEGFEKLVSPRYNNNGKNEPAEKYYWQIISRMWLCLAG
jgi:hypothetical protein